MKSRGVLNTYNFTGVAESTSNRPIELNLTTLPTSASSLPSIRSNQITTKRHHTAIQHDGILQQQSDVYNIKMAKL